ncbi:uncharacterized protein [Chironomus tepperi]|uniref:uncharacterized protein isoform X2 n=1 Tax=Chironomus tepperi TaxID=113505 RepID=UPI00391F6AF5
MADVLLSIQLEDYDHICFRHKYERNETGCISITIRGTCKDNIEEYFKIAIPNVVIDINGEGICFDAELVDVTCDDPNLKKVLLGPNKIHSWAHHICSLNSV